MALLDHRGGPRKPIAEINVVPFIDVMLVLLVIFMITTPLLMQGVKSNYPKQKPKRFRHNKKNR
jgi:biopolymer transport protein TolR